MSTPDLSRRAYLTLRAMEAGATMPEAMEAVSSVLIEHPDLDPEERRTWWDWAQDEEARATP